MHVPFTGEQDKLALGELRIHDSQRDAVESQVPSGIPRVFPLIGHGDDIRVVEVLPLVVTPMFALDWWQRLIGVAFDPFWHVVIEELFAPDHPGQSLALHEPSVWIMQ